MSAFWKFAFNLKYSFLYKWTHFCIWSILIMKSIVCKRITSRQAFKSLLLVEFHSKPDLLTSLLSAGTSLIILWLQVNVLEKLKQPLGGWTRKSLSKDWFPRVFQGHIIWKFSKFPGWTRNGANTFMEIINSLFLNSVSSWSSTF